MAGFVAEGWPFVPGDPLTAGVPLAGDFPGAGNAAGGDRSGKGAAGAGFAVDTFAGNEGSADTAEEAGPFGADA